MGVNNEVIMAQCKKRGRTRAKAMLPMGSPEDMIEQKAIEYANREYMQMVTPPHERCKCCGR